MPENQTERYQPKEAPDDAPVVTRGDLSSSEFTYPVKLVEVKKVLSEPTDPTRKPVLQLYQVFERQDTQWPDGNPVRRYNRLNIQYQSRETGEILPIWEGSDADRVGEAFDELVGCDMWPDTPDTALFINHFFMVKDEKIKRTESLYLRVPVEYLGPDYKYEGQVRVLESAGGDAAAPQPAQPTDNPDILSHLVDLLNGRTEAEVRGGTLLDVIQEDEALKGVRTVLGVSLRGGFVQPKAILLDKMVAEGLVSIGEDGAIQAVA